MITETGRVVGIEQDSLWVETIQQSTCNSCAAEKGCGQGLIAKWGGHTTFIRVLLAGRSAKNYQLNEEVTIAIPEDVVVKGSLFVYLLPLVFLLGLSGLGHYFVGTEVAAVLGGGLGFLLGALLVRWHSWATRDNTRLQPQIQDRELDGEEVVHLMEPSSSDWAITK